MRARQNADSVIAEMGRIAFAIMQDYPDVSDPTKPKVDLSRLTPAQASVIAEATVDKQGFNQRVKIKLHDKLSALTQLGKHLGLFKDRHEHTAPMASRFSIRRRSKWWSDRNVAGKRRGIGNSIVPHEPQPNPYDLCSPPRINDF